MYLKKIAESGVLGKALSSSANFLGTSESNVVGGATGLTTALGYYLLSGLWDKKGENRLSRFLQSVGVGVGLGVGAKYGFKFFSDRSKAAAAKKAEEQKNREAEQQGEEEFKKNQDMANRVAAASSTIVEYERLKRRAEAAKARDKGYNYADRDRQRAEIMAAGKKFDEAKAKLEENSAAIWGLQEFQRELADKLNRLGAVNRNDPEFKELLANHAAVNKEIQRRSVESKGLLDVVQKGRPEVGGSLLKNDWETFVDYLKENNAKITEAQELLKTTSPADYY